MRILHFKYSLISGGAERFVVDLCNQLSVEGHDIYLCVLRDETINNQGFYKNEISKRVNYINLKIPPGLKPSTITKLNKIIMKLKPDIVHCHQNLVNYVFFISLLHSKIKFFYTTHSDPPKEVNSPIEYGLRRLFFLTNKFHPITISNENSKSFKQYYKVKNFTEIYNGRKKLEASTDFKNVNEYINNLKDQGNVIFLHVARCVPEKNQQVLINVFNRLNNEKFLFKLLVIGAGFDSELGERLRLSANRNIVFLGQKHNVADYYLTADAFCLSSLYEGMPITLIESMACGCVPICTPVGGIIDTIKNGITGFISESTSEEDYYFAVKDYIKNHHLIKRENLISYFDEHFSIEKCAEEHIQVYNRNNH